MPKNRIVIFTVGHSTLSIKQFIELLKSCGIEEVADVRSIPRSRHNPQFNENRIIASLKKAKINYKLIKKLGGLRHAEKDSINLGWRNASFRGYADYMSTPDFAVGLKELMDIAKKKRTAIMCAEAVPWRCHRSLIADALIKKKWKVFDIFGEGNFKLRKPTPFLRVRGGRLVYPIPEKSSDP